VKTIEHQAQWATKTQQRLALQELTNQVAMHLLPPQPCRSQDNVYLYLPRQMDCTPTYPGS
ncbi:MAG: hypothetical protein VCA73_07510, partial [Roseibacillus sp.]